MLGRTITRSLLRAAPRMPSAPAARMIALPRAASAFQQRGFALSSVVKGQGEMDAELSSKLAQEIEYERENSDLYSSDKLPNKEPEFVKAFKSDSLWKINDVPGTDEVVFEHEYGNEHVRVFFSIGDVDTASGMPEDDLDDGEETSAAPTEEEDEDAADFPVRVCITISKPAGGALSISATAQAGEFEIDQISWYADASLANTVTVDADFQRKAVYLGPHFETLDEAVQAQFEEYLAERGVDANLALFIPNFAEYKEQREYCAWLENVRTFVDA